MSNAKAFSVIILCLAFALTSTVFAVDGSGKISRNPDMVFYTDHSKGLSSPTRDDDDFMTFRFMVSPDGGDNWSEILHTGDHGMWEGVGEEGNEPAWGNPQYDFGAIVDNDNMLHFISALNLYNPDYNPLERENGLYDIKTDATGDNVTYTLIVAEPAGESFSWADAGKDADGNLYIIWVSIVTPEEGDVFGKIMASKSEDGGANWTDPFLVFEGLDPVNNFPHMTLDVGDFFFVIYEIPNPETGAFDHFVAQVPAALAGDVTIHDPGAASAVYYSYYVGSVSAIGQDVDEGFVYFAVRNQDNSGTAVGSFDGANWSIATVPGAQRYPAVMMQPDPEAGGVPWVMSNYGPSAADTYHKTWYSYDALGYNGGDWLPQTNLDSVLYNGTRDLLYCHTGVVTTDGRLVSGCNVWGSFTPEGFQVLTSDNGGESWSESQRLWSIFPEGEELTLVGGNITQNHMLAGMNNSVWIAFCGRYGETDFDPPVIGNNVTLSSYMLNEPWVVSVEVTDNILVNYVDINWTSDDIEGEEVRWDYAIPDSVNVTDEETGSGIFWFTLPSDTMLGEALVSGDSVWFFFYADDEAYPAYSLEHLIIVNTSFTDVQEPVILPVKLELGQNYPNPFNNSTVIPFSIDRASDVKLSVFDLNGRLVDVLHSGDLSAGQHQFSWYGNHASTGIYFYVLETAGQRHIAKMTLLR